MTYVITHKPAAPHECDYKRMFLDQRSEGWPNYTLIECEDCGQQLYYVEKSNGVRHLLDVTRWNRRRIERKAGLR